jgi:hypothetical protein
MLSEFQQALADLVASPPLCAQARRQPELLGERYQLDSRELGRLQSLVGHPGMAANCMLYRANRLSPLALNFPLLCASLGEDLRPMVDAYWASHPTTNVHFLIEADRFRTYVGQVLAAGALPAADRGRVAEALASEGAALDARLAASQG